MDKIWDGNPSKSEVIGVVAGMKKPNDHAEPTKSNAIFLLIAAVKYHTSQCINSLYKCQGQQRYDDIIMR